MESVNEGWHQVVIGCWLGMFGDGWIWLAIDHQLMLPGRWIFGD
jgi:superoxide dismutase